MRKSKRKTWYERAAASGLLAVQTNAYACGPCALRHALLRWGIEATQGELQREAGTTRASGTGEAGLIRAAAGRGIALKPCTATSWREASRRIDAAHRRGRPLILCVDDWEHWIVAPGRGKRGAHAVLDSSRPGPVLSYTGARGLARRLRHSTAGTYYWLEASRGKSAAQSSQKRG